MVAQLLVNFINRVADYGRTQMPNMEGLCNIGRGIVDHNGFACAHVALAIAFLLLQNGRKHLLCVYTLVHKKIDICTDHLHLCDKRRLFDFFD